MQHYKNVTVFHRLEPMTSLQHRDKQKSEICKELGT